MYLLPEFPSLPIEWHLCSIAVIPVRFNPDTYTVTEGVDANSVVYLEAVQDHPRFGFNVTVRTQDESAAGEYS